MVRYPKSISTDGTSGAFKTAKPAERQGRESILTKNTIAAEEERKAQTVFDILGDNYGSRAQTATRFVLGNPDVSCAIVGLAETAHLDEAVAAMEMGPLPEAAMAHLEGLYTTDFERI